MVGWLIWWIEWVINHHLDIVSINIYQSYISFASCFLSLCNFCQVWRAGRIHCHPDETQHWGNWDSCKNYCFYVFLSSFSGHFLRLTEYFETVYAGERSSCLNSVLSAAQHWMSLSLSFTLCNIHLNTNTVLHPPTVWWLKCSVVLCVLRHPCTDASFWEPGRNLSSAWPLIQCACIHTHTPSNH